MQGALKGLLQHHSLKASILWGSAFFLVQLSHPYMTTRKTIGLTIWTFVSRVMSLLLRWLDGIISSMDISLSKLQEIAKDMKPGVLRSMESQSQTWLSNWMTTRFVIAFLPRSKCLLIAWMHSWFTVILEPKKIKSVTVSSFSQWFAIKWWDWMPILVFWMYVLSQVFYSPLSPSSKGSLVPLHFLPLKWYHLHIWGYWYFSQESWFQLVSHLAWHFTCCTLYKLNSRVTALTYSFANLEPVHCSMFCCFLSCIQVSQETSKVVWYSHLFKNFPQFVVTHTVKGFRVVNKAELDAFLGITLLFLWSNRCWKFDFWFVCLF